MTKHRRIDEMYAFVTTDPADNTEGVIGMNTQMGWVTLVGADMEKVEQLRMTAQSIANMTKQDIRVVRFSVREVLETITPNIA